MPGTTWNWIRCSKFSSRVRSLRSRGRNRPRFFIGRVKGTCSRLRHVKESTHGYQFVNRRQTHRGRSKKRRSSKEKRSASPPHSRSLSNATSSNEFWLPSEQSTLIRVTTTKQRGAGSACDGSGGYSGLAFGFAAPASDLASQQQQFAPNWCAKDAFKGWAPLDKSCFRVSAKHRNSAEFEPTCALLRTFFSGHLTTKKQHR